MKKLLILSLPLALVGAACQPRSAGETEDRARAAETYEPGEMNNVDELNQFESDIGVDTDLDPATDPVLAPGPDTGIDADIDMDTDTANDAAPMPDGAIDESGAASDTFQNDTTSPPAPEDTGTDTTQPEAAAPQAPPSL